MANNFRFTANASTCFVDAQAGSDGNSGLTPDLPKQTLGGALNTGKQYIIAHGHFVDNVYGSPPSVPNILIADGYCIIENKTSAGGTIIQGVGNRYFYFYGVEFRNINGLNTIATPTWVGYVNCKFKNCVIGTAGYGFIRCEFQDTIIPISANSSLNVFINSLINYNSAYNLQRNYFNAGCLIVSSGTTIGANFTYNICHNNRFKNSAGTYYDNLAAAASPLSIPASNINEDPLFNSPQKGDFTVQAASPCLDNAKNGGTPIANAILGIPFYWSNGTTGWTLTNCSVLGGNSLECSDATSSSIIKNADSPIDVGSIKCIRNLDFLGLISFVAGSKINVPAVNQYTAGQAGLVPKRLTFGLKWSETSLTEAQWNAKNWIEFDIKLCTGYNVTYVVEASRNIFRYDGVYGDGNPSFDYNMLPYIGNIKARYILLKFVIRNDF